MVLTTVSKEELAEILSSTIKNELIPFIKAFQTPKQITGVAYLSRKQAAAKLGISLPTLHEWTKSGIIVGYRVSSRVRYKEQELESSLVQIKTRRAA